MTSFTDSLREWLSKDNVACAQPAEPAQVPPCNAATATSAGCAGSAQRVLPSQPGAEPVIPTDVPPPPQDVPPEWSAWNEDARYAFLERLGVADEQGMEASPGSEGWNIAVREARREQARVPLGIKSQAVDAVLDAFSGMGLTVQRITPKSESADIPGDGYRTSRSCRATP